MTSGKFCAFKQVIKDFPRTALIKEVEPLGKNLELPTLAKYIYYPKNDDPIYTHPPSKTNIPFFEYFELKTEKAHLRLREKLLKKKKKKNDKAE